MEIAQIEPSYDDLAFDPSMPRCDIDKLKNEIKHLKDLQSNQDKYVEELTEEKEKLLKLYDKQITQIQIATTALEDIGYCKSRIYQNRPFDLVKNALDALKKIREINNDNK